MSATVEAEGDVTSGIANFFDINIFLFKMNKEIQLIKKAEQV